MRLHHPSLVSLSAFLVLAVPAHGATPTTCDQVTAALKKDQKVLKADASAVKHAKTNVKEARKKATVKKTKAALKKAQAKQTKDKKQLAADQDLSSQLCTPGY